MKFDNRLSARLQAMSADGLSALEGKCYSTTTLAHGEILADDVRPRGTVAARVDGTHGYTVYFLGPQMAEALLYERAEVTTMNQTRSYRDDEFPRTGDVVRLYDGSFGDAVVDCCAQPGFLVLRRPHLMLEGARFALVEETVTVPQERVRQMPVYVTGPSGHIENRAGLSGSGPNRGEVAWARRA